MLMKDAQKLKKLEAKNQVEKKYAVEEILCYSVKCAGEKMNFSSALEMLEKSEPDCELQKILKTHFLKKLKEKPKMENEHENQNDLFEAEEVNSKQK